MGYREPPKRVGNRITIYTSKEGGSKQTWQLLRNYDARGWYEILGLILLDCLKPIKESKALDH